LLSVACWTGIWRWSWWCCAEFLRPPDCPVGFGVWCDLARTPRIGPFGCWSGICRGSLPAATTFDVVSSGFGSGGNRFGCILGSIRYRLEKCYFLILEKLCDSNLGYLSGQACRQEALSTIQRHLCVFQYLSFFFKTIDLGFHLLDSVGDFVLFSGIFFGLTVVVDFCRIEKDPDWDFVSFFFVAFPVRF
jgi:hypothetical protein